MAEIQDWFVTANDNDTGSPPDWAPEGFDPTNIDNVEREHQAVLRRWYGDQAVTTTSYNAGDDLITVTTNRTVDDYFVGLRFTFRCPTNASSTTTLRVGSLDAKDILYPDGSNAAGDLVEDGFYDVVYDGTQFQLLSNGAVPNTTPLVRSLLNTTQTLASADVGAILSFGTGMRTVQIPTNPTWWPDGGRMRFILPAAAAARDLQLQGTQTLWRSWGANVGGPATVQMAGTEARTLLVVRLASGIFGAFRT